MPSFTKNHPFICSFYCITYVLPLVISLPIISKDDPFDKFTEFLSSNNCSMPKEVELPFSVTDSVPFSYLSYPLNECKTPEAMKDNTEANLLCREVFEVIQNITCFDYKLNTSQIEGVELSDDVCHDFAAMQNVIPKQKNFLSSKLQDDMICKVMCMGKFELLCKTLLWGYNTQAKLKNATSGQTVPQESHPNNNEIPDEKANSELQKAKKVPDTSGNDVVVDAKPKSPTADETTKNETNPTEDKKKESENNEKKTDANEPQTTDIKKTDNSIKASKVISILPKAESTSKSSSNQSEQDQNIDSEQSMNVTEDKNNDLKENNIEMPSKSSSENDKINVPTVDVNMTATEDEKVDVDKPKPEEDKKVDVTDDKKKITDNPKLTAHEPEEKNDQKKSDEEIVTGEEGGAKKTQSDVGEDPKENEIPNGENDSNVPPIFPDKSDDFEPQPQLKDPEQYNDSENDGDYAKQEYDTVFNPAPKKESNLKNTLNEGSSPISGMQISNENYIGRESDMNRNFLASRNYLPDQEDGHFFFYFLTIVLVLMAGYLIFHNKQKIIALIVEGRHERRRRSHGAGYKKLETK